MFHKYPLLFHPLKPIFANFLLSRTTSSNHFIRLINFDSQATNKRFDAKRDFCISNPLKYEQEYRYFSSKPPYQSYLYCSGCGSKLQSINSKYPGFVSEITLSKLKNSKVTHTCQRCEHLNKDISPDLSLSHHKFATNLLSLKLSHSIVLLVVDLLTFPIGVYRHWTNLIPKKTPIIVLLNKVDLVNAKMVGGDINWGVRYKKSVLRYLQKETLFDRNIVKTEFVSGLKGTGIDNVAHLLFTIYAGLNAYLFGSTNSGKSTIFNYLQNTLWIKDMPKSTDTQDILEKSTISKLPGTTQARVAVPIPIIGDQNKIKGAKILHKEGVTEHFENPFTKDSIRELGSIRGKLSDTPGVGEEKHLLSFLTLEELEILQSKHFMKSSTYEIEAGDSLLIAALARVDFLHDTSHSLVKVNMFFPSRIPLFKIETSKVRQYLDRFRDSHLKFPTKSKIRKIPYPQLIGKEVTIDGANLPFRSVDIIVSNLGWLNVSIGSSQVCTFKIHTPKGRGIVTREPIFAKADSLNNSNF